MGQVWECEQLSLRRTVALKLLLPERIGNRSIEFFEREARAGGRLTHPGIVAVYATGQSDNQHWIAQEFVEGGCTLRDFVDDLKSTSLIPKGYYPQVSSFIAQLADALHAAHQAGVIHRDIKPQNILITPDDEPKVTDFGLARITDESALSASGDIAGTFLYMSPEQVKADTSALDHRTDIFSLGVVLYEMLTLQRPFEGDTSHQIAEKIVRRDPPPPIQVRSQVPLDLATICGKALEKEPRRRYQSMSDFASDLRRHLAHVPIQARAPGIIERGFKWARRNPTFSASAAVAILALVLISSLALRLQGVLADLVDSRKLSKVLRFEDLLADKRLNLRALPENIAGIQEWIGEANELTAELPTLRARAANIDGFGQGLPAKDLNDAQTAMRWSREQLQKLIQRLEQFSESDGLLAEDGVSELNGWSMPKRERHARALAEAWKPGGSHARRWEQSLAQIRKTYPQLDLAPQLGLVPIGHDPISKLWEFWHVQSGAEPLRASDGTLVINEDTSIVLVLIPGGTYFMGAQNEDENAPCFDPLANSQEGPIIRQAVDSFFISKYEMTQFQWKSARKTNPSRDGPDSTRKKELETAGDSISLLQPIERVSWFDCMRALEPMGLTLPTEEQWEYAARAGSQTPWFTGKSASSLINHANIRGKVVREAGNKETELTLDIYGSHAPINSMLPNQFGLHETLGNVWEWCLNDRHESPQTEGKSLNHAYRGGSYDAGAERARVTDRGVDEANTNGGVLGLRPCAAIIQ